MELQGWHLHTGKECLLGFCLVDITHRVLGNKLLQARWTAPVVVLSLCPMCCACWVMCCLPASSVLCHAVCVMLCVFPAPSPHPPTHTHSPLSHTHSHTHRVVSTVQSWQQQHVTCLVWQTTGRWQVREVMRWQG